MNNSSLSSDSWPRALALAVRTAGHHFPVLSTLQDNAARRHELSISAAGYSVAFLDVTLDVDGHFRLIEANGSNAALSSIAAGGDVVRASHMARTFLHRTRAAEHGVALLGHQGGFLHIPEFFARAALFATEVPGAKLRGTAEALGEERIAVVVGSLSEIAPRCNVVQGRLFYRGRRVCFATNTNLLPELMRHHHLEPGSTELDTSIFHEGSLVPLIHDKTAQQRLAAGTGIEPIACEDFDSREDATRFILKLSDRGRGAVLKMNGGSGGAGIEFCPPNAPISSIHERWDQLASTAREKYGAGVEATMLPVRVFEFVRSTPYQIGSDQRLWDLRVQCLISPSRVEIAPVILRLCPEPFDPQVFSRDSLLSNLTGRKPTTEFMRSPWRISDNGEGTVLEACGINDALYKRLIGACALWCERAMHSYSGLSRDATTVATG